MDTRWIVPVLADLEAFAFQTGRYELAVRIKQAREIAEIEVRKDIAETANENQSPSARALREDHPFVAVYSHKVTGPFRILAHVRQMNLSSKPD